MVKLKHREILWKIWRCSQHVHQKPQPIPILLKASGRLETDVSMVSTTFMSMELLECCKMENASTNLGSSDVMGSLHDCPERGQWEINQYLNGKQYLNCASS